MATPLSVKGQWRPHCQWKVSGDPTVSGRSMATPLSVAGPHRGCRISCSLTLVVSAQLSGDTTVGTWTQSGCRTSCTEHTLAVSTQFSGDSTVGTWTHSGCRTSCTEHSCQHTAQWRGDFALKTSCLLV